jgi:4-amino-4-deoxy-L-arabinose transferase-like glycosyltransferase
MALANNPECPEPPLRKLYGPAGAWLLLLVLLCELTLSIRNQSLSWDEGDHIFAGYMAWKTFDYGLNPEHPPLVKALATLPLLAMHLGTPVLKGYADFRKEAYFGGRDLLFGRGEAAADRMIFTVRMAAAIFSLLLGWLVFIAAREMFGTGAALFALALLVFEPNLIAHGAYVTTDMGIACLMFASVYSIYRYVKAPSAGRLAVTGAVTGLALAAKHSGVLLLPIGIALLLAEIFWCPPAPGQSRWRKALQLAGAFLAVMAIALFVLWTFYGYRYAARPAGLALNPSLTEYISSLKGVEPAVYKIVARLHILPESYLFGLIDVRRVSNSFPTYIFGQVHAHGVWYYFPAAFLIKSTIGFVALLLIAGYAALAGKLRARRELLFLTIPPLVYVLIATGTGLNIGARHNLPIYPFLFVLIGGAVYALSKQSRAWAYAAAALLAFHMISASLSYPVYLAYSNEFWGGPSNTYKYLSDSNTDWGQQLKAVKHYLPRYSL